MEAASHEAVKRVYNMGMYTKLDLIVDLRHDTPDEVIEALHIMCRNDRVRRKELIDLGMDHPFFETDRCSWMFRGVGSMDDDHRNPSFTRDEHGGRYSLSVSFDIKNYTNEIERFLNWIGQYVDAMPGRVGTYQYEEEDDESVVMWTGEKLTIVGY